MSAPLSWMSWVELCRFRPTRVCPVLMTYSSSSDSCGSSFRLTKLGSWLSTLTAATPDFSSCLDSSCFLASACRSLSCQDLWVRGLQSRTGIKAVQDETLHHLRCWTAQYCYVCQRMQRYFLASFAEQMNQVQFHPPDSVNSMHISTNTHDKHATTGYI